MKQTRLKLLFIHAFIVITYLATSKAEVLFEHHITSDSIENALAPGKDSENDSKIPPKSPLTIDLNKVNSSNIKPTISFDLIDETLVKIEQQLAALTMQLNQLKEHVIEVKRVARVQADEEKTKTDRLTVQLQEVGKQLAAKTMQTSLLQADLEAKQRLLDASVTTTNTPAHLCNQDPGHSEQHAGQ